MSSSNDNGGALFRWVSSVALPIALTVSSVVISMSVERSKVSSSYVTLAVGILGTPPSDSESEEQIRRQDALKDWAGRIVLEHSPIEMTIEERYALLNLSELEIESLTKILMSPEENPLSGKVVKELEMAIKD